jgi:hypothetical protein
LEALNLTYSSEKEERSLLCAMLTELDEWRGLLGSRSDSGEVLLIEQPLKPSVEGGSGVFLARADDGRRWWVKPQNNLQGAKVVVTEYLVGSLGGLIGAPVCEVAIARLPEEIVGWEFRPGATLQAGLAHASRDVEDAQLLHALDYRQQDDNRHRHAGVFALYDWCWGGDDQWLYCHTEEHKLYSHDHGWYLPETGPDWSEATLLSRVDEPHPPGYSKEGLNTGAMERIAGQLEQVDKKKLLRILRSVPTTWAVTDTDLEALGFFLERRAPAVADRLRRV